MQSFPNAQTNAETATCPVRKTREAFINCRWSVYTFLPLPKNRLLIVFYLSAQLKFSILPGTVLIFSPSLSLAAPQCVAILDGMYCHSSASSFFEALMTKLPIRIVISSLSGVET